MSSELSREVILEMLGERSPGANKGDNGKGLLLAGSPLMGGAAVMCAAAALRSGVGTLKAVVPQSVRPLFYPLAECMCISFGSDEWNECAAEFVLPYIDGANAICIGPGLGQGKGIAELIKAVLGAKKPTVIDADGLNALANIEDKSILHKDVVLTPHIGEMARLSGLTTAYIKANQEEVAAQYAEKWGCTVLLKSHKSAIACYDGRQALNTNGNSGLAKGGSGDVLAGIALAMLGQKPDPFKAACCAAYILGASADEALGILKTRALMARDVISAVKLTINNITEQ